MKLIDLSREIHHKMARLPNHPMVIIAPFSTHEEKRVADGCVFSSAVTSLNMGDHSGTHVDAPVHFDEKPGAKTIDQLNELEYIKGEIYANVWHSDKIARISPKDGHVIAWIDLADLLPPDQRVNAESVLNGIAYDAQHDRLFVTGKQWPAVFEIKVVPLSHDRAPAK